MSIVLSQSRSQNQTLYSALKKSLRGKKAKRRREFNGSMTISKNLERKVRRRPKRKVRRRGKVRRREEKKGQKNPKDQLWI